MFHICDLSVWRAKEQKELARTRRNVKSEIGDRHEDTVTLSDRRREDEHEYIGDEIDKQKESAELHVHAASSIFILNQFLHERRQKDCRGEGKDATRKLGTAREQEYVRRQSNGNLRLGTVCACA